MQEMQDMWVWSLGQEDSPGEENGNLLQYSWENPGKSQGQRNLPGYSPWSHKRVGLDWATECNKVHIIVTLFLSLSLSFFPSSRILGDLFFSSFYFHYFFLESESESHSIVSNSSQPHGILQARILEWVAFPFSRGSSQPRDQTQVSRIAIILFTSWATRKAQGKTFS